MLEEQKPVVVIGSQPSTTFSALLKVKPKSAKWREMLQKGWNHLTFCEAVYKWQSECERRFQHEYAVNAQTERLVS